MKGCFYMLNMWKNMKHGMQAVDYCRTCAACAAGKEFFEG